MRSRNIGGNSGYVGYSESVRSREAKAEGKFPKTEFKRVYKVSEKKLDEMLDRGVVWNHEWHHTSKFGNKTYFYEIADYCLFYAILKDWTTALSYYKKTRNYAAPVHRNKFNSERKTNFLAKAADYAAEQGLTIGDTFTFMCQPIGVISLTKRRKHPVCRINK